MSKKLLAIATCRVSSIEQLESNSLNRQFDSVKEAAQYLDATIPSDGLWSGSVSSKSGCNYDRKDLRSMLDYCKKNPGVKYLIVDEIDRFMRSIDEMFYYEVEFREKVGVKVWYAGDPALNSDDPLTKLRRAMEAFKAEGSNLERQLKSIKGQTAALKDGRYPFSPKPGYRRGYEKGIQEIDTERGQILRAVLIRIASQTVTPTQALVELNKSDFMNGRAPYKMDKFRKIITDPFYAGIVEVNKQVKIRNENGLHEPLISKEQHGALVKIMDSKKKNQSGPRKNGNPKYPLSNHVHCDVCKEKPNGRYVGFDHGNGKSKTLIYEKYRCRGCGKYLTRQALHSQVVKHFADIHISDKGMSDLIEALDIVWKQHEGQAVQVATRIRHKIESLNKTIGNRVSAITDPDNASIRDDIRALIEKEKDQVIELGDQLSSLRAGAHKDRKRFLEFAFNFVDNMGDNFLDLSPENRERCKQLVFPAGFHINVHGEVYTPQVSPLYRLAINKKDHSIDEKSLLVRVRRL